MRTVPKVSLQEAIIVMVIALVVAAGCLGPATPAAGEPAVTVPSAETPAVPPSHPPTPLFALSLTDMQKNWASGTILSLPTFLPEGYFFTQGSIIYSSWNNTGQKGTYGFLYRRGQEEWVYLTEKSRDTASCPEAPVFHADNGSNGAQQQKSSTGELSWGKDGWCFNLSGSLSREELENIIASVKPVPYREGVIPPYEYQPPAQPLICNVTMNRSSTTGDITIAVESLVCSAESCTVKVRLGISSPPSFSVPPGMTAPPEYPDPHAEWRVDGGRPLINPSGQALGYRPEGDTTVIFWTIEPIPEDSRTLSVNFSRIKGITGPWVITVPLATGTGTSQTDPS
jgi:hypothetical protein